MRQSLPQLTTRPRVTLVAPVELLEQEVDDELDELAARDSEPRPARVRRPLRERVKFCARARERALERRDRGAFVCWLEPTHPAEIERLGRVLERQRAAQRFVDACTHPAAAIEHCEGGVDVCKLCRAWWTAPGD